MNSCVQVLKNHIHDGKQLINIGERKVDPGHPVYVIAEIFQYYDVPSSALRVDSLRVLGMHNDLKGTSYFPHLMEVKGREAQGRYREVMSEGSMYQRH
jgi:hypothetical protein